jgi:hypothetical protein
MVRLKVGQRVQPWGFRRVHQKVVQKVSQMADLKAVQWAHYLAGWTAGRKADEWVAQMEIKRVDLLVSKRVDQLVCLTAVLRAHWWAH